MRVLTQRATWQKPAVDVGVYDTATEIVYIPFYGGRGYEELCFFVGNLPFENVVLNFQGMSTSLIGGRAVTEPHSFLRGEDYPALVAVWDNDVDAIYDTI